MSSKFGDEAVGERLLSVRMERGLSQQAIADELGVSLRTYQNYERGDRPVSKELLCGLVEKYRVDVAWVLTGERSPGEVRSSDIDVFIFEAVAKGLASEDSEYRDVNSVDFARMAALIYNQVYRVGDEKERDAHIKGAVIMLSISRLDMDLTSDNGKTETVFDNDGMTVHNVTLRRRNELMHKMRETIPYDQIVKVGGDKITEPPISTPAKQTFRPKKT